MEEKKFLDEVLGHIPRATWWEKRDIRDELAGHLEDHALDLEERGCSTEEARAQAVAAMGDPGEIGEALNVQLSTFWLRVRDICMGGALCLFTIFGVLFMLTLGNEMEHRMELEIGSTAIEEGYSCQRVNFRYQVGSSQAHFFQIWLSEEGDKAVLNYWVKDVNPARGAEEPYFEVEVFGEDGATEVLSIANASGYGKVVVDLREGQDRVPLELRNLRQCALMVEVPLFEERET